MRDAEAFDRHSTEALNLASAYIYSERKGERQGERKGGEELGEELGEEVLECWEIRETIE